MRRGWYTVARDIPVTGGTKVSVEVQSRVRNVVPLEERGSYLAVHGFDGVEYRYLGFFNWLDHGTRDWELRVGEKTIPGDIRMLRVQLVSAGGTPERPAETWVDDLRILQDDVLIYKNKFTSLWPLTGVALPIVTGLGAVRFGKKG